MDFKNVRDIYNSLGDGMSQEIYAMRWLWNLTGDKKYLSKLIQFAPAYSYIDRILKNDKKRKIIYGAGDWGKIIGELFTSDNYKFDLYVDKYKTGEVNGVPIISLEKFIDKSEDYSVYVCMWDNSLEAIKELLKLGIKHDNIVDVVSLMRKTCEKTQYFDLQQLQKIKGMDGCFIDCGCYDGSSSKSFVKLGFCPSEIIAFEPDNNNISVCSKQLEILGIDFKLINKGCWREKGVLRFFSNEVVSSSSHLSENGNVVVNVTSIDDCVDGPVKYIKMDIEGAEVEALYGAERIIRKYKPALAISIYHKFEDLWTIPNVIRSFNLDYQIYVRHYWINQCETVLYAV